MTRQKYTAELLAPIVASARSFSEVLRALELPATGGNYRHIAARIRYFELDTSHFTYGKSARMFDGVAVDRLAELVRESRSFAQVLAALDAPVEGRPHRELTARIRALDLDTSHFRGQGWCKGETSATHPSVARGSKLRAMPDEQVFVANSPLTSTKGLRNRLLSLGWDYRCAWCGIVEWRGLMLVLHVDHINGIHNDNRVENLRFLCPNCHSQTPTYGNRRR